MISLKPLFEMRSSNLITMKMINSIPNTIFNNARRKSGEYRTRQEFFNYASQTIEEIIRWNPRKLTPIVQTQKIIPLFDWGNGDICCYSLASNKLLDFDHNNQRFVPSQWS